VIHTHAHTHKIIYLSRSDSVQTHLFRDYQFYRIPRGLAMSPAVRACPKHVTLKFNITADSVGGSRASRILPYKGNGRAGQQRYDGCWEVVQQARSGPVPPGNSYRTLSKKPIILGPQSPFL
jgi:hypothetical protein